MRIRRLEQPIGYRYPEHLGSQLQGAPAAAGVYIFRSSTHGFPLYIGKSINIRARLLTHFRDPDKARVLRAADSIECLRTAGELGALLLEAQLIKTLQPLHNKRLRRIRRMFSLDVRERSLDWVDTAAAQMATDPGALYGIFPSYRAATEKLRELADVEGLCYRLLGLETGTAGRACFRFGLGRCRGACVGVESVEAHFQRLRAALHGLELLSWPYPGRVAVAEQAEDLHEFHIVDRWQYLGTVPSLSMAGQLAAPDPGFDRDGYRLLVKPMLSGRYPITPL